MRSPDSHFLLPFALAAILVFAAAHPTTAVDSTVERHAAEPVLVEGVAACPAGDSASCDDETEELIDEAIDLICGEDGGVVIYECTETGAIIWAIGCWS